MIGGEVEPNLHINKINKYCLNKSKELNVYIYLNKKRFSCGDKLTVTIYNKEPEICGRTILFGEPYGIDYLYNGRWIHIIGPNYLNVSEDYPFVTVTNNISYSRAEVEKFREKVCSIMGRFGIATCGLTENKDRVKVGMIFPDERIVRAFKKELEKMGVPEDAVDIYRTSPIFVDIGYVLKPGEFMDMPTYLNVIDIVLDSGTYRIVKEVYAKNLSKTLVETFEVVKPCNFSR